MFSFVHGPTMRPILCFGEALIDFHPHAPDSADAPPSFVPFAGGAPANVAVAVARLGGNARFAGMLGKDMFGDFLLRSLERAGVGTDDVVRTDAANTALAFVALDAHGERSFTFYRPPSADLLFRAEHFRAETFDGLAVFHVCSNSMTESAIAATTLAGMRLARGAGALVSFDMNLRPALWPAGEEQLPRLWAALHAADLVKLSAEEFAFLHEGNDDTATLARIWHGHARVVIVTDGAAPLRWFTRDAEGIVDGWRVSTIDSTAAGDAFVGGLLCRLSADGVDRASLADLLADRARMVALLRFAAACGAITVTRKGSFTAIPDESEVHAFLETHA
jgi:fructokinase